MELSLRSSPEAVDPSLAPLIFSENLFGQCFQVATVTVLAYDAVITMDNEIKYFWKFPLSTVNIVYFANRYIGIFGSIAFLPLDTLNVDLTLCKWQRKNAYAKTNAMHQVILPYGVETSQTGLRISRLIIFLQFEFLQFTPKLAATLNSDLVAVGQLAKDVIICGIDNLSVWQLGVLDWVISAAYGVLLMVLALYKAAEYWRMSAGFRGSKLVRVIIEDQVIYFSIVVAVSVMNVLAFRITTSIEFLADLLTALGNPAFLSILGSRMLVNLKEAGEQGLNEGTSYRISSKSVSDIDFAEPNEPVAGSLAETIGEQAA